MMSFIVWLLLNLFSNHLKFWSLLVCGSARVRGGGVGIVLCSSRILVQWFWNSSCHLLMMSNCWHHHAGPHASLTNAVVPCSPICLDFLRWGKQLVTAPSLANGGDEESPVIFLLFCFTRPAPLGGKGENIFPACKKGQNALSKFWQAIKLFCWNVSVEICLGDLLLTTWIIELLYNCAK